jgi:hypothetical protein
VTVTAANALKVDGSAVVQPITDNSGSITVDAPVGTPVYTRLSDGTAALAGQKTMANSVPVTLASDQSNVSISIQQLSGNNIDKNTGTAGNGTQRVVIATDQPAFTNDVPVKIQKQTTGGATPYKLNSAASTNATSVKASAGNIYGIQVYNTNASARYLKLYNKSSAPTVGSDTPVKVITIPGSTTGAGSNITLPNIGVSFGNGIAFAITTGAADSDTGAVAANEIIVNIDYN